MQERILIRYPWKREERYYYAVLTPVENEKECTIEGCCADNRWVFYLDGKERRSKVTKRYIPAILMPATLKIFTTEEELKAFGYRKCRLMFSNLMTRAEVLAVTPNTVIEAPNFTAP